MNNIETTKLSIIKSEADKILPDTVNVVYEPAFPNRDGSKFSWFQIIFSIGPGEDEVIKAESLQLIERLFEMLIKNRVQEIAEIVSIRIRRRTKDSSPEHPPMYIEVGCNGIDLNKANPKNWYDFSFTCVNRFDRNDPMNKIQNKKLELNSIQPTSAPPVG